MTTAIPCSAQSRDLGESIAGTAVETTRWILLEADVPWSPKPIDSACISPQLRVHLQGALDAAPRTRLQLIRRPGPGDGRVSLMAAVVGGENARIHGWTLPDLNAVCDVDIAAAWTDDSDAPRRADPVVLVCTHGRRDRCCAKAGTPVFHALADARPGRIWQTTHLGGHRFAATAVVLPTGVQYGRLEARHVPDLLVALDAGRIMSLDHYRGRTDLSRSAQAAAIWIRSSTGQMGVSALRYLGSEHRSEHASVERFDVDGTTHAVSIVTELAGSPRSFSCGGPPNQLPTVHRIQPAGSS